MPKESCRLPATRLNDLGRWRWLTIYVDGLCFVGWSNVMSEDGEKSAQRPILIMAICLFAHNPSPTQHIKSDLRGKPNRIANSHQPDSVN